MKTFYSLEELTDFGPVVATIGNFDGVHRGHQWVIGQVNARARELGVRSLAITFDPHPVRVLRPDAPHSLITPLAVKLELLAGTGIDATLVLPFTPDLSRLTAEQFAREILRDACCIREIHEGETFRFGYRGEGDMHSLEALGEQLGFGVKVYSPYILRGGPVSSSRVRRSISAGEVGRARALLGRPLAVRSTPASGRGYGTKYAVPTINLAPYPELLPGNGVYVTRLEVGQETFQGVTNVGNRPTFGEDSFAVETHLLDFHPVELLPETRLELTFLHFLRGEKKWESHEALMVQIRKDVAVAQRFHGLAEKLCGG